MASGTLGQAAPGAGQTVVVYVVPKDRKAKIVVIVCNRGDATSFRVSVCPGGAPLADEHYIAYDQDVEAKQSVSTLEILVGSTDVQGVTDVIRVSSASGLCSFTVSGAEEKAT